MSKGEKKITLLTHVSYDENDKPYIGSVKNASLRQERLPKGRLTGFYGRNASKKANIYLWDYFDKLGKVFSRADVSIQSTGSALINQGIEDLGGIDILNILLSKVSLTDKLEIWSEDNTIVKPKFLSDRPLFRKIAKNPEIINKLFEREELKDIKAIIWPTLDPDNSSSYITMITLRELELDLISVAIYNYDEDSSAISIRI